MKKGLIKNTKSDDVKKFEVIFKKYYLRLIHFAIEYVLDYEVAREIVQDSMIKLWEKFQDLNFENNVIGYLYSSVKNNCINYLKHQTVKQKYTDYRQNLQTDNLLNLTALNNFSYQHIEYKQLKEAVNLAIKSLPSKCQKVFILSRQENFSHKEISEKLNISTKTIENHINVAIKKIRDYIADFIS
jgi:RNA polymerase sigma-70 factor (ECF subfamily)